MTTIETDNGRASLSLRDGDPGTRVHAAAAPTDVALHNLLGKRHWNSRDFLLEYFKARVRHAELHNGGNALQRLALLRDIHIKVTAFALLNKAFFVPGLILSVAVVLWPVVAIVLSNTSETGIRVVDATVAQTAITGLAAICIFGYRHYKGRQLQIENLMRTIVYGDLDDDALLELVMDQLARIDAGFTFRSHRSSEDDDDRAQRDERNGKNGGEA